MARQYDNFDKEGMRALSNPSNSNHEAAVAYYSATNAANNTTPKNNLVSSKDNAAAYNNWVAEQRAKVQPGVRNEYRPEDNPWIQAMIGDNSELNRLATSPSYSGGSPATGGEPPVTGGAPSFADRVTSPVGMTHDEFVAAQKTGPRGSGENASTSGGKELEEAYEANTQSSAPLVVAPNSYRDQTTYGHTYSPYSPYVSGQPRTPAKDSTLRYYPSSSDEPAGPPIEYDDEYTRPNNYGYYYDGRSGNGGTNFAMNRMLEEENRKDAYSSDSYREEFDKLQSQKAFEDAQKAASEDALMGDTYPEMQVASGYNGAPLPLDQQRFMYTDPIRSATPGLEGGIYRNADGSYTNSGVEEPEQAERDQAEAALIREYNNQKVAGPQVNPEFERRIADAERFGISLNILASQVQNQPEFYNYILAKLESQNRNNDNSGWANR